MEKTLVVLKPQVLLRNIENEVMDYLTVVGEVIAREVITVTNDQLDRHFSSSREWIEMLGRKAKAICEYFGIDPADIHSTLDPYEIGKTVREWNRQVYLKGPVVVLVMEGEDVISRVRKITGSTFPFQADPGTIRRDFCGHLTAKDYTRSAIDNLIHAADSIDSFNNEVPVWFPAFLQQEQT
jgi:nucleoside-diphosphate kinase